MSMNNDLPDPALSGGATSNQPSAFSDTSQPDVVGQDINLSGGINKEIESATAPTSELGGIKELGQDIDLPKEVSAVGVSIHPTTVVLPPGVSQMGVTPTASVPSLQTPSVALPLTDDQIVLGLKQSVSSSWRWLAEWCIRRLKQIHKSLTSVRGK